MPESDFKHKSLNFEKVKNQRFEISIWIKTGNLVDEKCVLAPQEFNFFWLQPRNALGRIFQVGQSGIEKKNSLRITKKK